MTSRKITTDNSVRHIPKSEQATEIKQNTIKKNSPPQKQEKNISQNNKKILENVATQRFGFLK